MSNPLNLHVSDLGAVGVGIAAPFLAGAVPLNHGLDLQAIVTAAVITAVSAAAAAASKGAVAAIGAFIRAQVRKMRGDDNPKNDAFADKIDPDGKVSPSPVTRDPSSPIAKGPQP